MRLWLDDIRIPPWGYDLWAKTADEAIDMLQRYSVKHCSLDHDLADEHYVTNNTFTKEKTGYAVLDWMHETGNWCSDITIHSLNPSGALDMMVKLRNVSPDWVVFRQQPFQKIV